MTELIFKCVYNCILNLRILKYAFDLVGGSLNCGKFESNVYMVGAFSRFLNSRLCII